VDGGMVANELLMQFQADLLNVPVIRPQSDRNDSLGGRLCCRSGRRATGPGMEELRSNWAKDKMWQPEMNEDRRRQEGVAGWRKAVQRTLDWVD
jgi:glycerol kinase